MDNIKLSPSKLNRYPIAVRMIDIGGKTSVSVSFTEKTVDIKIDEKACVLPKANFFNKHYEEFKKIYALGYPKLQLHCIMDNLLKDSTLYVYDIYCNDNFFAYQDIEKLFAKAGTSLIKSCPVIASGNIDYDEYIKNRGDKAVMLRPMWYPASEIWKATTENLNTFSFALE
jgi:hypothetical protein